MSPNVGLGTEEGTRGWDLYITSIVMVLLAGAFVIGRIVQRSLSRAIGVDDYLIVASLVSGNCAEYLMTLANIDIKISSAILSVTEIQAVVNGYGQRYEKLTLEQATSARRWSVYVFHLSCNQLTGVLAGSTARKSRTRLCSCSTRCQSASCTTGYSPSAPRASDGVVM